MCQPMSTGLYARYEFDEEFQRLKSRQNKFRCFENMVMSYFKRTRPDCRIESFYTTGTQKKIDCFNIDEFCAHCNSVWSNGLFLSLLSLRRGTTCPNWKKHSTLNKKEGTGCNARGLYRGKRLNCFRNVGMQCDWWKLYKTDVPVKEHLRESFPYKPLLRQYHLWNQIKSGALFGYVQCDIKVPQHLREKFANFPPIFKNTHACKQNNGPLLQDYAQKKVLMSQPRRMLISTFELINGTIITPLLLFYLELGLVCTKTYRFVENTPVKCFNNFVQSAVNAHCQGDENPNSSVLAETMKLLANNSYRYQIMDRSRHPITKYTNDEKTHAAIDNKMFKKLGYINDQLYEVELVKSEIEHKEPIIVAFFVLQYAMLRILELYHNFFTNFCDTDKYEEIEMDTDSLCLALGEKELYNCIRTEKRQEWELLRSTDCIDSFTEDSCSNFFPQTSCV